ncbi:MAG: Hpt domain-containing protein [Gammaproteobacteria bacterium]|nr:Hpt domain-containing protein [Gammaproteobacteria bacterium]
MTDTSDLLKLSTINELKEVLDDDIFEIYSEFRSDNQNIITQFNTAAASGNEEAVLQLAHTLKGTAGNIGLHKICNIADQLEKGIRNNSSPDISSLINQLESSYNQTLEKLIEIGLLVE